MKTKICCPSDNKRDVKLGFSIEELAELAKALGHPIRLQIISILQKKKTCICGEIVEELPLAQSTVSQHLKVLKEVGLIRGDVEGPKTCYCLNESMVERFKALVSKL